SRWLEPGRRRAPASRPTDTSVSRRYLHRSEVCPKSPHDHQFAYLATRWCFHRVEVDAGRHVLSVAADQIPIARATVLIGRVERLDQIPGKSEDPHGR